MMSTSRQLLDIKGISEAKVNKIKDSCQKIENFTFITASSLLEKRKSVFKISTGSTSFDELLKGGIESASITEVFGEFRTGKSQLCMTLCVTAQLPQSHGGGNGKVIFIGNESV